MALQTAIWEPQVLTLETMTCIYFPGMRAWEIKKLLNWYYSKKLSQNLKTISLFFCPKRERNTRLMFDPQHFSPAEKPCRGAPEGYSCLLLFSATGLEKREAFHIPFWSLRGAGKDYDFRDFWPGAGNAVLSLPTTDRQKELQATTLILDSISRAG